MLDIKTYENAFKAYARPYEAAANAAPLRLKVEHTFKVLEHTRNLVLGPGSAMAANSALAEENPALARAALLAALFHDCGRFEQFARYATFSDAKSANHAHLGLATLKRECFFSAETPFVRHLAQGAVLLHNRYALPAKAVPALLHITNMVRDADKLDILRVMVLHLTQALPENDAVFLHVADQPQKWTPKILDDVMQCRVARYSDLRYVNDFRLLLCTWWHELTFALTRSTLQESGLMETVISGLPAELSAEKQHLRKMINTSASRAN